jgi:hypothetical protein
VIEPQTTLKLSPDVTFRSLGEGQGAVIVETKTGELYSCNDTTAAFLEAIDGQRSFNEIVGELHGMFEVDRAALEADLNAIGTDLLGNGLIVVS